MANNYLQFSLAVGLRNDGEKEWCREALEYLNEFMHGNIDPEEDGRTQLYEEMKAFDELEVGCGLEFEWSIDKVEDKKSACQSELWIQAGESGNPDQVAAFLQAFLKKHRPKEGIWFSWCYLCDSPRVNEFGGGAAAITADEMKFFIPENQARSFLELKGLETAETNLMVPK
jgi:hypothetical protein